MPAPGSRFEFPEWSWDTWSQHRLLSAQGRGILPGASGCAQGAICGAAWEGEGEKLGYLVRAGCQAGSDGAEQMCVDTWDQGTKLPSHPSLLRGGQDREGHRGASPGSCQRVQGIRAAGRDTEQ